MGLSEEHRDKLAAHYCIWGLDEVRRELDRAERDEFVPPEVTEFTRAWVAAEERRLRLRKLRIAAGAFAGVIVLGAAIGAFVRLFGKSIGL